MRPLGVALRVVVETHLTAEVDAPGRAGGDWLALVVQDANDHACQRPTHRGWPDEQTGSGDGDRLVVQADGVFS